MKVPAHITRVPIAPAAGAVAGTVAGTSVRPALVAAEPVLAAVDAPPDAAAEVGSAGPRFCRTCGATWDPAWTACEPCGRDVARAAVLREAAPASAGVTSALAFYFTLLAVCAAAIAAGAFGAAKGDGGLGIELFATAGLSVVTIVWAAVDARRVGPPLCRVPHPLWFAAAVGLSLVTVGIATGTIGSLRHLVRAPAERMSDPFLAAGYGWGFVVLCTCVQPAVVEELAFRGVIFAGVGRVLSRTETVLVTALMFMILHLSPVRFPHTLALGLGAGYLRTRTGSLYPCIAMHFAHNLLCVGGERFGWF